MKLIVARRGQADDDGNLTEKGRQQMAELGTRIANTIGDDHAYVISSLAGRMFFSADIIRRGLDCEFEEIETLGTATGMPGTNAEILFVVRQFEEMDQDDFLIMVCHKLTANTFPHFYLASMTESVHPDVPSLTEGQALMILEDGTFQLV